MKAETDPLIGFTVDRYQIIDRIGVGAMGCVYRAKHTVIERESAVKVLFGEMASDKKIAERFRREAKAISRMRHPNIVNITDFGTSPEGLSFLVMELIQGSTLKDVVKSGQLSGQLPRIANITRQIGEGLGEAHSRGLIHRDMKPGNVMLEAVGTPREQVKILDFGIVGLAEGEQGEEQQALTHAGVALGTPAYMAPEQAQGEKVGPTADFYALGVILYEMLAGSPPFRGTLSQVMVQHISAPPPLLPPCGGLEHIAYKLLQKVPSNRIGSAPELFEALDSVGFEQIMPSALPRSATPMHSSASSSYPALSSGSNPIIMGSNPSIGSSPALFGASNKPGVTTSIPAIGSGPMLSPLANDAGPLIPTGPTLPPLSANRIAEELNEAKTAQAPSPPPAPAFLRDHAELTSSDRATITRPGMKPHKSPLPAILGISTVLGLGVAAVLALTLRSKDEVAITPAPDPVERTSEPAKPDPAPERVPNPTPAPDPPQAEPQVEPAKAAPKPEIEVEPKASPAKEHKEPKHASKAPAKEPKPAEPPNTDPPKKEPDLVWETTAPAKKGAEDILATGRVSVKVVAQGANLAAKIYVDGKLSATAPADLALGVGEHTIRIETDDGTGAERKVFVRPGSMESTIFEFSE